MFQKKKARNLMLERDYKVDIFRIIGKRIRVLFFLSIFENSGGFPSIKAWTLKLGSHLGNSDFIIFIMLWFLNSSLSLSLNLICEEIIVLMHKNNGKNRNNQ